MHIGVTMFATDRAIGPADLAREAEARGFHSLYFPEHTHIPVSRKTPPPTGDPELPEEYKRTLDPFVALGAAASATSSILLGTGICLVAQRDPIQTAKSVASIDQISKGRFLFGVGNGWNQDEMENHGTDFKARHKIARERIEAMKAIWTKSKPEYAGEFVKFGPMMTWPKPVQKPHPPVLVGGAFPYAAKRAVQYGDGWMPHRARPQYENVRDFLPKFAGMLKEAGRDPASAPVTIWGAKDADMLKRDRDAGVVRVIVSLESDEAAAILPELDRWAKVMQSV